MTRPRIGVTGPDRGGSAAWLMTRLALLRAGGEPVRLTPRRPRRDVRLDALVLGGGADLDPASYTLEDAEPAGVLDAARLAAKQTHARAAPPSTRFWAPFVLGLRRALALRDPFRILAERIDHERDRLERSLLAEADDQDLPVLGICRGAQVLNVFYGGTLHPDVAGFYVEAPYVRSVLPRKRVVPEADSRLAAIVGARGLPVNALHHQAVRRLGRGLRVVARDTSGVVQAIERDGARLCLGVQWHPEFIPQHTRQLALFGALVDAARARAA